MLKKVKSLFRNKKESEKEERFKLYIRNNREEIEKIAEK